MSAKGGRVCRVEGLSSARGRDLNGSVGRSFIPTSRGDEDRVAVLLDGTSRPLALKKDNVRYIDGSNWEICSLAAGRKTFRDQVICGVACVESTQELLREIYPATLGRAGVNLKMILHFLQYLDGKMSKGYPKRYIAFSPTDLNVSRALNKIAFQDDQQTSNQDAFLSAPLNQDLKKISRLVHKLRKKEKLEVAAMFTPIRLFLDDPQDPRGNDRVDAVLRGRYKIYPSANERYTDSLEVRFLCKDKNRWISRVETYLDFGSREVVLYVQNCIALGETDERLTPLGLATSDAQAFWAAILHMDDFLATMQSSGLIELTDKWDPLCKGAMASDDVWNEVVRSFPGRMRLSHNEYWGITTNDDQSKVSTDYAMAAVLALIVAAKDELKNQKITTEVSEDYRGTIFGNFIMANEEGNLSEQRCRNMGDWSQQISEKAFNDAYAKYGFGNDVMRTASDPLASCGECGENSDPGSLSRCGQCGGIAYCGKRCQAKNWKKHKQFCSPLFAEVLRQMRDIQLKTGIDFTS